MSKTLAVLLLASTALLAQANPGQAQQIVPSCTDDSRACMIAAATAYLDSIIAHDASKVPFAPDIRRTEQGRVTAEGEAQIRQLQTMQPDMAGRANTRFVVDERRHEVVAFTLLRVTGTKTDPSRKTFTDGVPPAQAKPSTVHLAERFKVEKGLITEIEAIFDIQTGTMDALSGWPD
jgi:hypothetical protein